MKELPIQHVQFGDKVLVDNTVCLVKHIEPDYTGGADLYVTDTTGVDHHTVVRDTITIVQ